MARSGGRRKPRVRSIRVNLLTTREWLQQTLPFYVTTFGPTPSRRNNPGSLGFLAHWQAVPDAVDAYVAGLDDSTPRLLPFDIGLLRTQNCSEATASGLFSIACMKVGEALELDLDLDPNVSVRSSGSLGDPNQRAVALAISPSERADLVVTVAGIAVLVVEMKRPAVFRRNPTSPIPRLDELGQRDESRALEPSLENDVMLEAVQQLYRCMKGLGLAWGILSSFDVTYAFQRQGVCGETLLVSEGILSTSRQFLGVLAFMLREAIDEPKVFKPAVPPTPLLGSLKSPGDREGKEKEEDDSKGKEKQKSREGQSDRILTQSQSQRTVENSFPETPAELLHLPETPAELLHLARHHFATGWSGRVVRGTYEGQSIVVKLAPIGSERAEALMKEVLAYRMLKEFWGKYVPQLVSYGTTVEGTIVYIATEEVNGYEIGMGPLSQEVVKEMFDALVAVHQCGILHGDIRPSNILIAQGQQPCVRFLDFGFACFGTSNEGCKREYVQLESLVSSLSHVLM